jgi:hypothetical protein
MISNFFYPNDLQLWLRNQHPKLNGFEDFEFWNQSLWNSKLKSGLGICKLFWLARFGILISEQLLDYHLN